MDNFISKKPWTIDYSYNICCHWHCEESSLTMNPSYHVFGINPNSLFSRIGHRFTIWPYHIHIFFVIQKKVKWYIICHKFHRILNHHKSYHIIYFIFQVINYFLFFDHFILISLTFHFIFHRYIHIVSFQSYVLNCWKIFAVYIISS